MTTESVARLRFKIAEHEIEIEGPPGFVAQHVERWAQLAGLANPPASALREPADPVREPLFQANPPAAPTPADLFHFDATRKLVVPRVVSRGRRRNGDAALLVLYGYRLFLPHTPTVPASLFRDALAASGCRVARLDRVIEPHLDAGLISKSGSRKRETYTLSVAGEQRAKAIILEHYVAPTVPPEVTSAATP